MKDVAIPQPQMPKQLQHLNEVRVAERETRRAKAWAMRLEGNTVRQIAEKLNISVGGVALYLQETMAELRADSLESATEWRQIQLDRLDAMIGAWHPVSQTPSDPEAARGAAIVIRAIEAQSRLLGLFEPAGAESPADSEAEKEPGATYEEQLVRSPALRSHLKKQLENAEKGIEQPITAASLASV